VLSLYFPFTGVISFTKTVYEDMTNLWPDVSVPIIFLGETNLPAALPSNVFDASVQLSQRAKVCLPLFIFIHKFTYTYTYLYTLSYNYTRLVSI